MGFFDKAREALGQAAAAVSRETEVLSLQSQLGSTDTELENVLVEVGKRARELYRAGKIEDREMGVIIRRVDELEEKMMALRQKVAEVQSPPIATPPPTASVVETTVYCSDCGEPVAEGAKFCGGCGAKIE